MTTLDQAVNIPIWNGLQHFSNFEDVVPAGGTQNWIDCVGTQGQPVIWTIGGGTPAQVTGKTGPTALEFVTNEYITDANSFKIRPTNQDFTLVMWVKLNNITQIHDLFNRFGGTNDFGYSLVWNNTGNDFSFSYSTTGADIKSLVLSSVPNPVPGDWNFLMIRRNGATLDGKVNGSGTDTFNMSTDSIFNTTRNPEIGAYSIGFRFANIHVDSWGWWNRALSDTEHNFLFNNGTGRAWPFFTRTPNTLYTGTRTTYRFGWNAGQEGTDCNFDHRRDLTQNNSPTPIVGLVGSGTQFNGSTQYYQLNNNVAGDWAIANREWSAHARFKVTNLSSDPILLAKNDLTGPSGNGTEWSLQLVNSAITGEDTVQFIAGHPTVASTHTLATSGTGVTLDDGDWHSVVWGFEPGVGQFIQLDGFNRETLGDLSAVGVNSGTANFTVARRDHATPLAFQGIIDSVHLWHRVLTVSESTELNTGN